MGTNQARRFKSLRVINLFIRDKLPINAVDLSDDAILLNVVGKGVYRVAQPVAKNCASGYSRPRVEIDLVSTRFKNIARRLAFHEIPLPDGVQRISNECEFVRTSCEAVAAKRNRNRRPKQ